MPNVKQIIDKHNAKIMNTKQTDEKHCNCQDKDKCPIPGECNQNNVIYQVEVHGNNKVMKYFRSYENFKKRYSNHKSSLPDIEKPLKKRPTNPSTLSSYCWKLYDQNIPYETKWSIKSCGHAFSTCSKACDLCLTEKLVILTENQSTMLNKRSELLETCRHRRKFLLVSLTKPHIDNG